MLIKCFIDAHHKACSPSNINGGFEKSGIFPLDPNRPLKSQYIIPEIPDELKVNSEDEILSGQWANSEEMLQKLFTFQHGHHQMPDER